VHTGILHINIPYHIHAENRMELWVDIIFFGRTTLYTVGRFRGRRVKEMTHV
jgi:hypothetical protein